MIEQIPSFIKKVRSDNNLTQPKFAKKLDCAAISIHCYESGKRIPSLNFIDKLIEVFPDCNIHEIICSESIVSSEERVTLNLLDQIESLKKQLEISKLGN